MIKGTALGRMTFVVICCAVIGGLSCKHATNPPPTPTPKPLDLLQPAGGEHYKVGDTVQIKWQINDSTYLSSVGIKLLPVSPGSYLGNNSFPLDTAWYDWIIDSTQVSSSCYIKICDYLNPPNPHVPPDSSGVFSITLN